VAALLKQFGFFVKVSRNNRASQKSIILIFSEFFRLIYTGSIDFSLPDLWEKLWQTHKNISFRLILVSILTSREIKIYPKINSKQISSSLKFNCPRKTLFLRALKLQPIREIYVPLNRKSFACSSNQALHFSTQKKNRRKPSLYCRSRGCDFLNIQNIKFNILLGLLKKRQFL